MKALIMNIFTYGSLMVPSIFISVTGEHFKSQPAYLDGYGRFCLKHDSYPGIIEAAGNITHGMVYFDVDDVAVKKLDTFEGEYYRRTPVCVKLDIKSFIDAETYIIKPQYRHILSSREWDFKNKFQDAFTQKYVGFATIKVKDTTASRSSPIFHQRESWGEGTGL